MYIHILKLLHVDLLYLYGYNCHNRSVFGCLGTIFIVFRNLQGLSTKKLLEQKELYKVEQRGVEWKAGAQEKIFNSLVWIL